MTKTKTKSTKRALLSSVIALTLCFAMLLGTTYAWFTDSVTSSTNKIVSGSLKVDLEMLDAETEEWNSIKDSKKPIFNYEKWEPGYMVTTALKIQNEGSLALKWKATFVSEKKLSILADVIDVYVCTSTKALPESRNLDNYAYAGTVSEFVNTIEETTYGQLEAGEEAYLGIALKMQETAGNEYKGLDLGGAFDITVYATQLESEEDSFGRDYDGLAKLPEVADKWYGEDDVDVSWYDPEATEYTLDSAAALAGLSTLVNESASVMYADFDFGALPVDFDGKTIKLECDVDLSGANFEPIGGVDKGVAFQGTFDGQGHTIYGLTESGWDLGYSYGETAGMGLFGWVGDATIKNVNIDSAEISMEAVVMGGVAGYAAGDCTFENITISNSQIANYNWDTGGIVGQAYGANSNFVFKNITIDESTTISGHWGTWDVSAGGVIGRTADGVKVVMEDITVSCVLDVYNDAVSAYQWYAYRYSGMLVGYTKTTATVDGRTVATAPHVTCSNVTVIYDDWANYTYCQFPNVAPQYVREQGGYSTDPYYSGRHWAAAVDKDGNKVVDANHTHNDGEAHSEKLVFDQLFGGGQGVYGTATHPGVTVIYNNK